MRRLLVPLLAVLVLVLAACGDDEGSGGDKTTADTSGDTPAKTETQADEGGCKDVEEPAPREVKKRKAPTFRPEKGKTYTWVLQTSCGTVEIRLATNQAPKTTGSIISLTRDGFFDGLSFHRIVPAFVVQGGDPEGSGQGGPGYSVEEAPPEDLRYTKGVVAMAKTELEPAGTSGSQFFIVTGDDVGLPPDYAYVGRVSKGMDIAQQIGDLPNDPAQGNRPIEPVIIEKATVETS